MSTEVVVYTGPEDAPGIKSRKGSDGAFPHKWRGVEICASTMATSAAPSRPKESASPNAPTSATSAWDHTRRLLALAGGKKPLGPRVIRALAYITGIPNPTKAKKPIFTIPTSSHIGPTRWP